MKKILFLAALICTSFCVKAGNPPILPQGKQYILVEVTLSCCPCQPVYMSLPASMSNAEINSRALELQLTRCGVWATPSWTIIAWTDGGNMLDHEITEEPLIPNDENGKTRPCPCLPFPSRP